MSYFATGDDEPLLCLGLLACFNITCLIRHVRTTIVIPDDDTLASEEEEKNASRFSEVEEDEHSEKT